MAAGILIFVILFVASFAVWQDYKVNQKTGRAAVLILSGLLLIGFIAEPKWWPASSVHYGLISDGFTDQDFDKSRYDSVYSIRKNDKESTDRNWLSSVTILSDFIPQGSSIDIYGYGIDENLSGDFHWGNRLQKPQKGLLLEEAPSEVEVGKSFRISIKPEGAISGDSLFVYKDGIGLESLSIDSNTSVSINDKINSEGPVSYDFEWLSGDSLIRESWNIRAIQAERLRIGIMTYSPSFEVNYLAGHLGERGHSILQRSRIGQNRFRHDAVNAALNDAESLLKNLRDLDVLILDPREFLQLNTSEQKELKTCIEEGLDVLLTSPDPENPEEWSEVFEVLSGENVGIENINRLEERNWLPDFLQDENETLPGIPLLNMRFSEVSEEAEILHQYVGNDPVSVQYFNKNGSVSGHLFYQSYSWLIGDHSEMYNRFWSDYLGRIIKLEAARIEFSTQIPRQHEPMEFAIAQFQEASNIEIKSVLETIENVLPMVFGQFHPEVATVKFWPKNTGWHYISAENQQKWFYVYNEGWEFDVDFKKFNETQNSIQQQDVESDFNSNQNRTSVPNWFWLCGFLMMQIYLWAERKFRNS
ncbi:MAG: hypothetical protein WD016_03150 [Balneolaceae bacterium]